MGNHSVGRAMASAAKVFYLAIGDRIPTHDEALACLDMAAEQYIGADAEFDDELYEDTPLRRLVTIAFDATPAEIAARDAPASARDDGWYEVIERFSKRYRFS